MVCQDVMQRRGAILIVPLPPDWFSGQRQGKIVHCTGTRAMLLAVVLICCQCLSGFLRAQPAAPSPTVQTAGKLYAGLPLLFEKNVGQAGQGVDYSARASGFRVFLGGNRTTLVSTGEKSSFALRLDWLGASPQAVPAPERQAPARSNYFIGNNAAKWRTAIANYERVRVSSLYPGVDLVYYGNQQRLEYDLEVAPGADPASIRLRLDGAKKVSIDEKTGDLIAENSGHSFRFLKPHLYQPEGGRDRHVEGGYRIAKNNTVSFAVGSYDHSKPLIIDPIALVKLGAAFTLKDPTIHQPYISYSTVFGGETQFLGMVVDASGYVFLAGRTTMDTVPTTSGVFQNSCTLNSLNNKCNSYFIAKFDTTQSGAASLLWSSYIGGGDQYTNDMAPYQINGNADFMPNDLAVDSAGNVYFAGTTDSSSYPVTSTAYSQTPTFDGKTWWIAPVLTKISADGTQLLYSTYFPASSGHNQYSMLAATVAVDANQVAYVAGMAYPYQITTDSSALSTSTPSSTENPYIFAIDTTKSGSSGLKYAEYVEMSNLSAIAVDASSNAYLLGGEYTSLSSFPGTAQAPPQNGFQTACQAPTTNYCAFLLQLDATGKPAYSTFIGAGLNNTNILMPNGLATEGSNTVYVAGWNPGPITQTSNGLSSYSSYTGVHNGNQWGGAFLSKIDTTQTGSNSLTYSTWLFGDSEMTEYLTSVADYGNGVVALTGSYNDEVNYPEALPYAQVNPIAQSPSIEGTVLSSSTVPWVIVLDTTQSDTNALLLFSQLEGIGSPYAVSFDSSGNLIVGGYSSLANQNSPFQAVPASYATTGTNGWDGPLFFYKIALQVPSYLSIVPGSLGFGNQNINEVSATQTLTLSNSSSTAITINSIAFPAGYSRDTTVSGSCSGSVPANSSCIVGVDFKPTAPGADDASITFTDSDSGSPQTVGVSGVGVAPAVTLLYGANAAPSADFGTVQMPNSSTGQVTLENTGTGTLNISKIQVGGTDNTSFSETNNCPAQVAASSSCTITVTFTPQAATSLYALLIVTDDATNSPQSFTLTGTGQAAASVIPIAINETIYTTDVPSIAESVQVAISETIHTSDAPSLAGPLQVAINEVIHTSDAPQTLSPIVFAINETIHTTDTPSTLESISVLIGEIIHTTDAPIVAPQTTVTLTWPSPAPIVYGTPLGSTQLDASSGAMHGTFVYSPPAGTILYAGVNQTLNVAFTPASGSAFLPTKAATTITVNPAPLTVSANNATRAYGTANPAFSGSVSGIVNGDNFTESFVPAASIASAPGNYAIVPAVTGADLSDYTQTILNGTLTVTQAATATTLSISPSPASTGQAVTFKATVAPATSGVPTGTVTFDCPNYASGQSISSGAIALAGGTAVWTTSSLSAFAYSNCFTAAYSGDTNFQPSASSPAQSLTVTDFELSLPSFSSPINLTPGGATSFSFTVQPVGGAYTDAVTFSITGLPQSVTATVNPASVTPGTNPVTVTVTLTGTPLALGPSERFRGVGHLALALLLPLIGLRLHMRRRFLRALSMPAIALAMLAAMLALNACSGTGFFNQTPKTYIVTLTGASGAAQHSTTFNLTVE